MGSCRCGETLITIRAIIAALSFYETSTVNFRSEGKTFIGIYDPHRAKDSEECKRGSKLFTSLFNDFLIPLYKLVA